jgi:thiol-disulfide isomerase/thioredoxin
MFALAIQNMNKKAAVFIQTAYLAVCLSARAAEPHASGIHFESHLNWAQIREKSKAENKYIFVDCYATWCEPCREMDEKTYTDEKIGAFLDGHFIAVRLQMDKTPRDTDSVKSWYPEADDFNEEYKIAAYPTFLFFAPDGTLVHRGMGFQDSATFLSLATDALNPERQMYTLIERYRRGGMDVLLLPDVIAAANGMDDKALAKTVSRDYVDHYVNQLDGNRILHEKNYFSINNDVLQSTDKIFDLCLHRPKEVDAVVRPGYSRNAVDVTVETEEIDTKLWIDVSDNIKGIVDKPDWAAIYAAVAAKYGSEVADRTVLHEKISWYRFRKDWNTQASYKLDWMDIYGADVNGQGSRYGTNNNLWTFFENVDDKVTLDRAATWARKVVDGNPGSPEVIDTLANLLYKAGHTQEAIATEGKAVEVAEAQAAEAAAQQKVSVAPDKVYRETLEKMKRGVPTWDTP